VTRFGGYYPFENKVKNNKLSGMLEMTNFSYDLDSNLTL
jgi:hypothetical protein